MSDQYYQRRRVGRNGAKCTFPNPSFVQGGTKRLLEWEPVRSLEEAIIDELNWAEKTYK